MINRRRCLVAFRPSFTAALVLSAGLFVAPLAGAQPATGAGAGPATAPTTVPTIQRPLAPNSATKTGAAGAFSPTIINKFIDDSVTRLANDDDVDAANVSRQDLIAASTDTPGPVILGYLQPYMQRLNQQLLAVFAKGSVRARVNAAIVAARVAENARAVNIPATNLVSATSAAMNDKSDAVSYWGMKAAAAIMNSTPGAPDNKLLALIPTVVQAHKLNGSIVEEAYNALVDAASPKVIDALISLYKARLAAYANGVPSEPGAERLASAHLTSGTGMWAKLTPAQQTQVMGLVAQAIKVGSDAVGAGAQQGDTRDQLRTMVTDTVKAVVVATEKLNPSLSNQAYALSKTLPNAKDADYPALCQPVIAAIQQQFPQGGNAGTGGNPVAKP